MPKKKYYGDKNKSGKSDDMMPMHSSAMSAMPQEVVMREYSREDYIGRPEYSDTYSEKNRDYDKMIGKMKKQEFHGV